MGTCLSNCKMKTFVILTTLVVSVLSKDLYLGKQKTRISNSKGADQFLDCYDYQNQGGNKLRAIDYIPALSGYSFDNRISSCCITGVWLCMQIRTTILETLEQPTGGCMGITIVLTFPLGLTTRPQVCGTLEPLTHGHLTP